MTTHPKQPKADPSPGTQPAPSPGTQPAPLDDLKTLPMAQVRTQLGSSPDGLSQVEAAKRLAQ